MIKKALALPSLLLLLSIPSLAAENLPAYSGLSDLAGAPAFSVALSTPAPAELAAREYENPPCVPSAAIEPGRGFVPRVSDARRERAISDLLARIAACRPMPYDNDGNVHSKPHAGLPRKPAGYYLEYTLIVPGRETGDGPEAVNIGGVTYMAGPVLSHRGAERLMIGGGREVYYTPDHYTTFVRLDILR